MGLSEMAQLAELAKLEEQELELQIRLVQAKRRRMLAEQEREKSSQCDVSTPAPAPAPAPAHTQKGQDEQEKKKEARAKKQNLRNEIEKAIFAEKGPGYAARITLLNERQLDPKYTLPFDDREFHHLHYERVEDLMKKAIGERAANE